MDFESKNVSLNNRAPATDHNKANDDYYAQQQKPWHHMNHLLHIRTEQAGSKNSQLTRI